MYKFIIGAEIFLASIYHRGKLISQGFTLGRAFLCFRKKCSNFFIAITDFYAFYEITDRFCVSGFRITCFIFVFLFVRFNSF